MSFWRGRRALVTGATGLVGSWLSRALIERGADVVALVRDHDPQSEFYSSGTAQRAFVVSGPIESLDTIERALVQHRVDTVFHLAAQTQVRTAYRLPFETFESNIRGTYALLEACRRQADTVERIVVASSDKAYGEAEKLPYTEETALEARFPYDTSKMCADLLCRSYVATYATPVAVARCGNIFGGGDLNWDRIVPGTMRSILQGEPPIIRSDGTLVRDYVYVEEVVSAYLLLAEKLAQQDVRGQAFNFSAGKPLNVLEMVQAIAEAAEVKVAPRVLGTHVAEISRQFLSSERAHRVLGWQARYPLRDALKTTLSWYRGYLARPA